MIHYKNADLNSIEYDIIRKYINLPISLDIETTSTTYCEKKVAFMYIWSISINHETFFGRTFDDLNDFLSTIKKSFNLGKDKKRLIIYIHNLAYEFQFIHKYLNITKVFAVSERKPLYVIIDDCIELKCSYMLSGYSLEVLAKNLTTVKIKKLIGDLDYYLIRHTSTKIGAKELKYLENDVLIITYYIAEQIAQYGTVQKIPLTNTGRIRRLITQNCYYTAKSHKKSGGKFSKYRSLISDLQLTLKEYDNLKSAFQGGFSHANANYYNQKIPQVTSMDFASAYPSVMICEKFPMSAGIKTTLTSDKDLKFYIERYCLTMTLKFTNIISTCRQECYISDSKSKSKKAIINNGRVFSADSLITTITDIDFTIINQAYTWQKLEVLELTRYNRGYLPKPIIETILQLYEKKTKLKNIEAKEVEYMVSKNMLNSVYGMCVTDILRDEFIYENGLWSTEKCNEEIEIERYNKKITRTLSYAWGVWITAYCRRNLWTAILCVGDDYIYSDTDSIKITSYKKHKKYFDNYNFLMIEKLKKACAYHNLSFSLCNPQKKLIGIWELDGNYQYFKTLGAKRYIVQENEKIKITVAGLGKKGGLEYLKSLGSDCFKNFKEGLYIPASHTQKLTHTYIDEEFNFKIYDYLGKSQTITSLSSIHLEPCEFHLCIYSAYSLYLKNLKLGYRQMK